MQATPSESPPAVAMPPEEPTWRRTIEGIDVLFGDGRLGELGSLVAELGGRRVLLVSDPGVAAAGHCQRALDSMAAAGLAARLFTDVSENPTSRDVDAGVTAARDHRADFLVAIGGGSAMDCAKGVNILLTNGGTMRDYRGFGHTTRPLLPSVGTPTTAGTGSEAQSYALITDPDTHTKMACGDEHARFRAVILDPALTETMPALMAAAAALDAVAHAVESHVTTRRSEASSAYALRAWTLLDAHLESALAAPADRRAWGTMQIAAFLAGAAIERSMLGAAHALANPITARYGTTHGIAVSLMLPHVVRFNGPRANDLYARMVPDADAAQDAAGALALRLETLRSTAGLPERLRAVGVEHRALPEMADEASRQWTLGFNPRQTLRDDLVKLYETAF